MPLIDHFSLLAPYYERMITPQKPEMLLSLLEIQAGDAVLDAGGGTGRIAGFLQQAGGKVLNVDTSFKMLGVASSKPGLLLTCSPVEHLPFPDGSFKRIVMVDALHHVQNQSQTLRELWRVLKPGGRMVIHEPDILTGIVKWVALGEKLLLMRSHILSGEEIRSLIPAAPGQVHIVRQDYTVWVAAVKPGG
ncbi:MAG TPA: class I SAM-dependent methyltransferase [Anaerolineaceae bacterium]